jgi:hypothetical protein
MQHRIIIRHLAEIPPNPFHICITTKNCTNIKKSVQASHGPQKSVARKHKKRTARLCVLVWRRFNEPEHKLQHKFYSFYSLFLQHQTPIVVEAGEDKKKESPTTTGQFMLAACSPGFPLRNRMEIKMQHMLGCVGSQRLRDLLCIQRSVITTMVGRLFSCWSLIRRRFTIPVRLDTPFCVPSWSNRCREPKMKNGRRFKVLGFGCFLQLYSLP